MKTRASLVSPPLGGQLVAVERHMAGGITGVVREETTGLKNDYRYQVRGAGMSARMANTWRANVYPEAEASLNPAGYVFSAAPEIVDSFIKGATIRPVNGAKWLWIPTKNVPARCRAGNYVSNMSGRGRGTKMTPEEVELHFNAELSVVIKGGEGEAFIDVVSGVSRGFRQATPGRTRGRKGMAPRKAKSVLMFVLRKGVKMPRLLDLQGPLNRRSQRVAQRIAQVLD